MPFANSYGAVSPGEIKSFSIDFSLKLKSGETITSVVSSTLEVEPTPPRTLLWLNASDANAANLLVGAPAINGAAVSQYIGAATNGFQPSVVYRWTVVIATSLGQQFSDYADIPCVA